MDEKNSHRNINRDINITFQSKLLKLEIRKIYMTLAMCKMHERRPEDAGLNDVYQIITAMDYFIRQVETINNA